MKAIAGIDAHPQRQRVDEEAHHRLELGRVATAHRGADDDLALAAEAMQQREHTPPAGS